MIALKLESRATDRAEVIRNFFITFISSILTSFCKLEIAYA